MISSHSSSTQRPARKILRVLKWLLLIALVIAGGLAAFVMTPESWIKNIAGEKASTKLGRAFAIDGPIKFHLDWTQPQIEINDVRLANLPNRPDADMIHIDRILFHIKIWKLLEGQLNLPDIELTKPVIILEKLDADTKNWNFPALSKANVVTRAALPSSRSNFPLIGFITIHDGKIVYRDKTLDLDTTLSIDTASGSSQDKFNLQGQGLLQGQTFHINADGGSLSMLRGSSQAYPLDVAIEMGKTSIKVAGTFGDPVNMDNIDAKIDVHGDNLADIFYMTGIPLPPSPPYSLSGQLTEHADVWSFQDFKGRVGESDLSGNLSDDTSGKRSLIKAEVLSNKLRIEDLKGFIGARTDTSATPQKPAENKKLIPDVPLNLTRLRASDMDIDFKATHIDQPGWPIDNMDAHFNLKDGLLEIDPLQFGVANGEIGGHLMLDGRQDVPAVDIDLILKRLSLKPFFTDSRFAALSEGRFGGRFDLKGNGKSLADVLAASDGHIALMMTGGSISKLIVDAAGLDVAKAVPALLGKDESTGIRCAIGDFNVANGMLTSDIFTFDTTASKIEGTAKINLKDETIDAKIEGKPKDVTISGQTPITISGSFRSPSIGLDTKDAAARGGAAAALSAVLTPLAGILPFIDIDPAKDSDCGALINAAKDHSGVNPASVAPPSPTPSPSK